MCVRVCVKSEHSSGVLVDPSVEEEYRGEEVSELSDAEPPYEVVYTIVKIFISFLKVDNTITSILMHYVT